MQRKIFNWSSRNLQKSVKCKIEKEGMKVAERLLLIGRKNVKVGAIDPNKCKRKLSRFMSLLAVFAKKCFFVRLKLPNLKKGV